ncbi:hypothetical protein [Arsenicibacter rosenii]|uniref:Uncharacterized protein n=1 Tax=Arsenicibacter rosenii TaxID=1750698 RepID=A0A1S2VD67_9BACT|nr:hypothetical protein [Arsenicibacter rosenii]OIN55868.1 hypothetical protein BLX24_27830 [Arsenicibacter rosenii]
MSNPFLPLVSLKGVHEPTTATYSVNDLPGISSELVSAVSEEEDISGTDLEGTLATWGRVTNQAYVHLQQKLEAELSKSADFVNSGPDTTFCGEWDTDDITVRNGIHGLAICVPYIPDSAVEIAKLICMNAATATSVEVVVIDLSTGVQLASMEHDLAAGYNELEIEFSKACQIGRSIDVFVGFDMTGLQLLDFEGAHGWTHGGGYPIEFGNFRQPKRIRSNLTGQSPGCLYMQAGIRTSYETLIGRYKKRLLTAYVHFCGSLLMTEKLGSSNFNLFTNTNREFTAEQEKKLMDDAVAFIKPVAREIVRDLKTTPVLVADPENQPGIYPSSYV